MRAFQIGLSVFALSFAAACGDDGGTMDPGGSTGSGGTTGTTGNTGNGTGGTGASGSGTSGGTTNGSGTTGSTTAGNNGSSTGGTNGTTGSTGSSTNGGDGDGGPEPSGACTNAADKAIVDAHKLPKLACEGAACAGKNVTSAEAQTKCIAEEAPTLKQLSPGCQACFDAITSCVPKKCVTLLGGSGECSLTLPNTDFTKCPSTAAPEPSCEACQMRECAPAFKTCSGISM